MTDKSARNWPDEWFSSPRSRDFSTKIFTSYHPPWYTNSSPIGLFYYRIKAWSRIVASLLESCMASDQERPLLPQREDDYALITERMIRKKCFKEPNGLKVLAFLPAACPWLEHLLTGIFVISLAKESIERGSDAAHYLDNAIATFNSAQSSRDSDDLC